MSNCGQRGQRQNVGFEGQGRECEKPILHNEWWIHS